MTDASAAWVARADELAQWAFDTLFVRHDVWGAYGWDGSTYTAPAVRLRREVRLDLACVERHFRARCGGDVIGAHSTAPGNVCRVGAVDIDCHDGRDARPYLLAALGWYAALRASGFMPLLTSSNRPWGTGGYHLRVLLRGLAPSRDLHRFLRQLTADYARHGMAAPPECFPKQPAVSPPGQRGEYGNWIRIPGRHYKRPHWSEVFEGRSWLAGAEAVSYMLALRGDDPALVPPAPAEEPRRPPGRRPFLRGGDGPLRNRIAAYIARCPNRAEGEHRDDIAYQIAARLARDLALPDDVCLAWLEKWDAGNRPPKGRERLAEILANARRYGRNAVGCGLRNGVTLDV